jgi:hypothetical protein
VTATIITFKRKESPRNDQVTANNDPRRLVIQKHYHSLLGMNQRQENMALKLSFEAGMRDELNEALVLFLEVQGEFREALEAYREQLLKALATKCPAAAKRIREGKPRPGRKP